jgi:hypothetical protein
MPTETTALGALVHTVRFLLELAALAALGWWGFETGGVALGIGAPPRCSPPSS